MLDWEDKYKVKSKIMQNNNNIWYLNDYIVLIMCRPWFYVELIIYFRQLSKQAKVMIK
jgi:hypothetical protein